MAQETRFEWDERKARENLRKHGVDFSVAVGIFADPHILTEIDESEWGELRYWSIGEVSGRVLAVVHTNEEKTMSKSSESSRRGKRRDPNAVTMKKIPKLNARMRRQLAALDRLPDDQIDTSDIPERTARGIRYRGLFYRPTKRSVTIRLDTDLLAWFKAQGRGYQSRINRVLREYFASHR